MTGQPAQATAQPRDVDGARLGADLRVVIGQLMRRLRTEHTLPLTHGAVLGRLDREGPQSTADLATAERVRPQSMAQILTDLEAQGLISRSADVADRRRTLIALTETGRTTLTDDRRRRDTWLADAIAHFSPEEQSALARATQLLDRLTEL